MSDEHETDQPPRDSGNDTATSTAVPTQESGIGGFVGTTEADGSGAGKDTGKRRKTHRNFFRRHLALTTLAVLILLVIGSFGGFVWYLNHQLGNIHHFAVPNEDQVGGSGGSGGSSGSMSGQPINILILGADNGSSSNTVADELADGHWSPGSHRSDTMMVMHIPANRKSAQIVSIPRDSWVPVPGFPGDVDGDAKINAAFSWGGPSLAVTVVKQLTGIPINHVAIMDWDGLKGLTDALGGVRVYIPQTFTDDTQHITWHQGWQTLNGVQALAYVRTRHGLANGDFGRIDRQQNFMRTIMDQLLSSGTITNPLKLAHVMGALSGFIELDDNFTTGDVRSLALSMRNVHSSDIQFATAPLGGYDVVAGQDIVRLDPTKTHNLFQDLEHGNLTPFLQANPNSRLPGQQGVD
jgi:LCP family protein required for cell wall assembly